MSSIDDERTEQEQVEEDLLLDQQESENVAGGAMAMPGALAKSEFPELDEDYRAGPE